MMVALTNCGFRVASSKALLFLALCALQSPFVTGQAETFHGDYQRTGRFPAAGPAAPRLLWKFQAGGSIAASPVIGPDGTVYVAATDGCLYALTPAGGIKWEFQADESLFATPSLDASGRLYFGDLDGWLYSLSPDGSLRWKNRLEEGSDRRILGSPAVLPEGVSFVSAWNNELYSFSPDGSPLWQAALNGLPTGAPALDHLGNVYVACLDSSNPSWLAVHKFSPASPTPLWTCREPLWSSSNRVIASPAVDIRHNRLYIGACTSFSGLVIAVDLDDGEVASRKTLPKGILSSAAIQDDASILVGCLDGKLYALGRDGAERWVFETDAPYIFGSPAIDRLGNSYVGDSDGTVYAISPAGQKLWQFAASSNVESAPIVDGGRLYVTSFDGRLYVLDTNTPSRRRERRLTVGP